MNKFTLGANDALQQYDGAGRQTRWPPLQSPAPASVWRPELTEQQRTEREQLIADGIIPF